MQAGLFRHMLVIVLQTSMTHSQEGKLAASLQNVRSVRHILTFCNQAATLPFWLQVIEVCSTIKPLLSLRAGKETWGGTSDSYFQNLRNYSMVIQSAAANHMRTVSNMAALGVEVQGANIR